ncbi:uncharacterized protein [Pocillopora verrucosa]|uniref:uncharacterized protein n=1 Tax=Pocillopora verrucosa TaxID=203993 RepID=UPI00333F659D
MKQSLPKLQCRSATVKKITTTTREPRRNRSKGDSMLQQPTLIRDHLALILLLLCASTTLISATDSTANKVVDYDVQFKESGTQYTEKIQVDTNKQTELFKVPAHNDVDGSNILHDFKANMSMLMLPDKKICYLLPLSRELPSPKKLENDLDHAEKNSSDETTTIDSKWAVDSEITNRSSLSEELKNFCPDYPIYRVHTMENASTSEETETDGAKPRSRRWVYSPIYTYRVCPGGKGYLSYSDRSCCSRVGGYWQLHHRVYSHTCYSVRYCYRWWWFGYTCRTQHYVNYVYCYEYKCRVY